jgi:dienelactone hydrolase
MGKLALLFVVALPLFAQNETVVLKVAGMEKVSVKNVRYSGELTFDLYRPPNDDAALPVVVFINGVGRPDLKDWGQYTSWPRLVATRGIAAISHQTTAENTAAQVDALLAYLRAHASELKLDASRIALWSCSANARIGTALAQRDGFRAAVFYYGAMTEAPKNANLPVLVARAGLDALPLNQGIDRWVAQAVALDAPVTLVTYPEGRHGFELLDDTHESRLIVTQTLDFLQHHLTNAATPRRQPMTLAQLQTLIAEKGIDATVARLAELRKTHPDAFVLQEASLNGIAYASLEARPAEAVKIFELVATMYPDSANAHDSLGDAYEALGRREDATRESERALALIEKAHPARREGIRASANAKLKRLR